MRLCNSSQCDRAISNISILRDNKCISDTQLLIEVACNLVNHLHGMNINSSVKGAEVTRLFNTTLKALW